MGLLFFIVFYFGFYSGIIDVRESLLTYWFPRSFFSPHSGQPHVMPLQLKPHRFSFMQTWHIVKPHPLHTHEKEVFEEHKWHSRSLFTLLLLFLLCFLTGFESSAQSLVFNFNTPVCYYINSIINEFFYSLIIFYTKLHPEIFRLKS